MPQKTNKPSQNNRNHKEPKQEKYLCGHRPLLPWAQFSQSPGSLQLSLTLVVTYKFRFQVKGHIFTNVE